MNPSITSSSEARGAAPAAEPRVLGKLLWYFLKLGTVGFGGPIALAGYMQRDLVDREHWFTNEEYLDALAFSQLSPGPLAAQLAMYLGFVRGGLLGATLVGGIFILPSFLMVIALAAAYVKYGGLPWMSASFYGIGAAVIAIIARSAIKLVKTAVKKDKLLWGIFLALLISTAVTEREIVWLFVAGGLLSLVVRAAPKLANARASCLLAIGGGALTWNSTFMQLLLFFTKASLFVFGSGLAIVPFLHGGIVQEHHWLNERQFIDAVAVAMITPGPVVITVAFVGFLVARSSGAVAAALGVFLPVYLLVVIFGPQYKKFAGNPQLRAFVQGVTAAATGAIAGAVIVLARRSITDIPTVVIAAVTLGLLLKWKIPEPVLIVAAGLAGVLLAR
jgi:chromate transporter